MSGVTFRSAASLRTSMIERVKYWWYAMRHRDRLRRRLATVVAQREIAASEGARRRLLAVIRDDARQADRRVRGLG